MADDELIAAMPQKEMNRLFKLADEAVSPTVKFSDDFEAMKKEANDLREHNMIIIWNTLKEYADPF